ncbi:hypothetical protein ACFLU6_11995, partial [Acidobacteriota bacterium]
RLSRSRLGLAILADVPATGEVNDSAPEERPEEPREGEDARIQKRLEQAYIYRDALKGDTPTAAEARVKARVKKTRIKNRSLLPR